ncbi:uncharacterized protein F4812DRAFT_226608 [Daldinia caldariorum]|uniref:uncharacterized protein n=1 Tax=Daldinia caldariorum TaxID=326644 RepID=UPI0020072069|nr:uncharacterized protein F4812DRAFT_226608 [Daldinia caldariorum]KAI1463912.1 hypothetical protein F4812DRAFT_226608 [Daldinia caldariorum]
MVETPRFVYENAGGFLPGGKTSLPSPAPSTASNQAAARLPRPRSKPLARGSRKEDYARNYVSDRLLHISRRYVKKHGIPDPADEVKGYKDMDELCKDMEDVVDVLWFSGTPSLQIPYLLNVALAFNTYLPSFPPSPAPTFALLKKLDHCFASLLIGRDIKSGDSLPGFQGNGRGLTRTDMVRCKSLVDETRMLVAMIMSGEPGVGMYADASDNDDELARPPTRQNIGVSPSTGLIQTPTPPNNSNAKVKSEDVIDFENDTELSDAEELHRAAAKRKSVDAVSEDEELDDKKRIKVEEGESTPIFSDAAPGARSPVPMLDGPGPHQSDGKFHWMIDDDDDDSDDDRAPAAKAGVNTSTIAPSTVQMAPDTEQDMGEPDGDSDGEEELKLNVGKVYEKTMIQLGKSLGESITDD